MVWNVPRESIQRYPTNCNNAFWNLTVSVPFHVSCWRLAIPSPQKPLIFSHCDFSPQWMKNGWHERSSGAALDATRRNRCPSLKSKALKLLNLIILFWRRRLCSSVCLTQAFETGTPSLQSAANNSTIGVIAHFSTERLATVNLTNWTCVSLRWLRGDQSLVHNS